MKYYIAARYDRREEMCVYANELRAMGHTVECRWLLGTHQLHPGVEKVDQSTNTRIGDQVPMEAAPFALDDFMDLQNAHAIILFTESPESHSKRGGRHVEFGMALAWRKELNIIGPRENVFHCLPNVRQYLTWNDFKRFSSNVVERVPNRGGSPTGEVRQ